MNQSESASVVSKIGLPPGEAIYVGDQKMDKTIINVIKYDQDNFSRTKISDHRQIFSQLEEGKISWINIEGLHDTDIIKDVLEPMSVHILVIEDVLNTKQRTKIEYYDEYIFIVLKSIDINFEKNEIIKEQISLVVGKQFVITFCENKMEMFEPLLTRIKKSKGRIRRSGSDYLTFAILDIIADNYFLEIEKINEAIESLEEEIFTNPSENNPLEIHQLKKQIISFRRTASAFRELLAILLKNEENWIAEEIIPFFRDVQDHILFITGTIESQRDMVVGLMDFYLSMQSKKMNDIMKVLTIIATIFIPLSFIAGVYGMNFDFIPELKLSYGYFIFWTVVTAIAAFLLIMFRRKKWL